MGEYFQVVNPSTGITSYVTKKNPTQLAEWEKYIQQELGYE